MSDMLKCEACSFPNLPMCNWHVPKLAKETIEKLGAERDQPRAELSNVKNAAVCYREGAVKSIDAFEESCEENLRLRARVERLEKALEVIWGGKGGCEEHHCAEIAEEALQADGEERK